MIYAATPEEIAARRTAFIRKWRLKHRAVADSLDEAGERLFTLTRLPPSQWRSVRTTNAIERLHEEFKRRIKTQTVLPSADTAAMLFWALLASGQINMRKVDGWQTLAASLGTLEMPGIASTNSNTIRDSTGLEIVPVSRMDEVLARAMTRKPEPIEWDETTTTAAAVPEEAPVEEEASTLTAH